MFSYCHNSISIFALTLTCINALKKYLTHILRHLCGFLFFSRPHCPRGLEEPARLLLVRGRGDRGLPDAGGRDVQGDQPGTLGTGINLLRVAHQARALRCTQVSSARLRS